MDACGSHVKGMDNTTYSADNMKFIAIIVQTLRGAVSPDGKCIFVVTSHCATFRPCILTDLYGFEVDAEYIFGIINGYGYILGNFFSKSCREFAPSIELSATD